LFKFKFRTVRTFRTFRTLGMKAKYVLLTLETINFYKDTFE
jgi:hypothetical protein